MFKNYKKFILIFLILMGILISLFLIYMSNYLKEKIITEPIKKPIEFLTIDIDGKTLMSGENNFIYSSSLRPEFSILVPQNIDIESLILKIDNSENVLVDKFYGETNINKTKRIFTFQPSFMFTPEKHSLILGSQNGESSSTNFNFILVFNEEFNEPLGSSKVWIIPRSRSSEWFNVQNGKLLAKPMTEDNLSSLAFLYSFAYDARIDFELSPIKNNVSLVFYFLEFGSFAVGSNGNKNTALLQKNRPDLLGKPFELLSGHHYHVYVTRKDFKYELAIKELINNERINPLKQFSDDDVLLKYTDIGEQELPTHKPNHIGFSLWQNSEGIFIDDIFITGFSN